MPTPPDCRRDSLTNFFLKGSFMFTRCAQIVRDFMQREDGPTAVEYAVMLALIIVVCIVSITALGTNANKVFNNVALNTAVGS
jgi:pilus assembly protein Flp/PilA